MEEYTYHNGTWTVINPDDLTIIEKATESSPDLSFSGGNVGLDVYPVNAKDSGIHKKYKYYVISYIQSDTCRIAVSNHPSLLMLIKEFHPLLQAAQESEAHELLLQQQKEKKNK